MIPPEQKLEMAVFIARKTGWTIEYMGSLGLWKFITIFNELYFQESQDNWDMAMMWAELKATIINTIPQGRGAKQWTYKDFLQTHRPTRDGYGREEMDEVDKMAKELGIELPDE